MAAITKTKKLELLVKQVNKYIKNNAVSVPPSDRSVLDTLMYAALVENTTFENADLALTKLQNYYIDWNEMRVCTVKELADTLPMLPEAEAAAKRLKQGLQALFEKTYVFDLEELRKRGKGVADPVKRLEEIGAGSPFMIDYTAAATLGFHIIPLDEAVLRILRRLGLTQLNKEETKEICIGLERSIPKPSGLQFAMKFHLLAARFYENPESPEIKAFFKAIDAEALNRSNEPPQLKVIEPPVSKKPRFKPTGASLPPMLDDEDEISGDEIPMYPEERRGISDPSAPKRGRGRPRKSESRPPGAMVIPAPPKPKPKPEKEEPAKLVSRTAKPAVVKEKPQKEKKGKANAAFKDTVKDAVKDTVKKPPVKKPVKSKSPSKDLRKKKPK